MVEVTKTNGLSDTLVIMVKVTNILVNIVVKPTKINGKTYMLLTMVKVIMTSGYTNILK